MKNNKLIIFLTIIGLVLLFVLLFIFGNKKQDILTGKYYALIVVKDYGEIEVELDADSAPITVKNFIELVNDNFYDGLTFHRIISGFMMQGGASETKEAKTIKGEFLQNGVENNLKHERGTISMARANDYNSASSQFFIVHEDYPSLDGLYAAFGHVTKGMDVVDKIIEDSKPIDNNGSIALDKQPIIEKIVMIGE